MVARGMRKDEIAILKGISLSKVYQILGEGSVHRVVQKRGRKPKISGRMKRRVLLEVRKNPRTSFVKIASSLKGAVSASSVGRIIKRQGITIRKPRRVHILTKAQRAARCSFSFWFFQNLDKIDKIVLTDEKRFLLDGPDGCTRIWTDPSRETLQSLAKMDHYGKRGIMVHLAMSADGIISIERLHGPITGGKYSEFLVSTLLPTIRARLGNEFLLQQDNAPPHAARITKELLVAEGVKTIDWPPYSPDLNPVENLWAIISNAVYRTQISFGNEDSLWHSVLKASKTIPKEMCENIVKCLPDRLRSIASSNWGYVK